MAYWGDKIRRFSFGKELRLGESEVVEKGRRGPNGAKPIGLFGVARR